MVARAVRASWVGILSILVLAGGVPASSGSALWPSSPDLCATPADVGSGCISPYDYASYLRMASLADLPGDYAGGDVWKYSGDPSGYPEIDSDPRELFGVTGMSIDRAWTSSTGRPDTVIAVLDSGIRWQAGDVRLKAFLNDGELPAPAGSTNPLDPYDLDFNGVLNVDDYAGEGIGDPNGNGHLDAGDLIVHFSDGVDDDENGYVDDISGWNFLDGTNQPFDEVDHGHGTGEAHDSTAEAGNGAGMPGVCPSCRFVPLRVGQSFIAHEEDYAEAVLYAVTIGASVVQEALGTVNNHPLSVVANRIAYTHGVALIASAADEAAYHHNFPSGHDYTINLNSIRTNEPTLQPSPRSFLYVNGCTNFGGNIWASVSSTSCSSEATGRGAGVAGLIVSHARNLVDQGLLAPHPDADSYPSGNPLSSGEIKQLIRASADDIDLSTKREVFSPIPTLRYASHAGWDPYTGFGRVNAERALALLDAGEVPPEIAITSPGWWSTNPLPDADGLDVQIDVGLHRVPGDHAVELRYGCGASPTNWFFAEAESVSGAGPAAVALHLPTDAVAAFCALLSVPPIGPDAFTVTLRALISNEAGVVGEDMRTIHLPIDPTLADGWPRLLEGSGEASVDLVDLDGDGLDEIVVPTSGGAVHAFRIDGTEIRGFPVFTDPLPLPASTLYQRLGLRTFRDALSHGGTGIADVDGDGDLEIFATSYGGKVYGWDSHGQRLAGFPVAVDPTFSDPSIRDRHNTLIEGIVAAPTLADLDADGDLEIVAAAMDRHVYAWHHDGASVQGFPVVLFDGSKGTVDPLNHRVTLYAPADAYRGAQIVSTTAVADIDGDGTPEIVVGSNEHYREPLAVSAVSVTSTVLALSGLLDNGNGRLYALHADGSYVAGFPVPVPDLAAELLPYVGEGVPTSPALADLDGDGRNEIVISATAGPAMVFRGDGTGFYGNGPDGKPLPLTMELVGPLSGAVDVPLLPTVGSPAIGPLLPGTPPSIFMPAAGVGRALDVALPGEQLVSQDYTAAWDSVTGLPLPAWPRPIEDLQFLTTPAIMNVDVNPLPEVVEGSGGYLLHAWKASGVEAVGFPKSTQGWIIGTAATGDLNGDGLREVVAVTREGWLFVWHTGADDENSIDEWWSDHHDEANTGVWTQAPGLLSGPASANDGQSFDASALLAGLMAIGLGVRLGTTRRR